MRSDVARGRPVTGSRQDVKGGSRRVSEGDASSLVDTIQR